VKKWKKENDRQEFDIPEKLEKEEENYSGRRPNTMSKHRMLKGTENWEGAWGEMKGGGSANAKGIKNNDWSKEI